MRNWLLQCYAHAKRLPIDDFLVGISIVPADYVFETIQCLTQTRSQTTVAGSPIYDSQSGSQIQLDVRADAAIRKLHDFIANRTIPESMKTEPDWMPEKHTVGESMQNISYFHMNFIFFIWNSYFSMTFIYSKCGFSSIEISSKSRHSTIALDSFCNEQNCFTVILGGPQKYVCEYVGSRI